MDRAWTTYSQKWGIFKNEGSEISYVHLPYLRTKQTGSQNAVMKRIQIPVNDDRRVAQVQKEIDNLKLIYGKDVIKYATSTTDNKLTVSEGGLTVYLALKSSQGNKQREFHALGNGNKLTLESTKQVRTEYEKEHSTA